MSQNFYSTQDVEKLTDSLSVLDYFQHLERQGLVKFQKKYGKDYYFVNDDGKFSVSDKGFYDFKSGNKGGIINAVRLFENKGWKEALDFISDFTNTKFDYTTKQEFAERKKQIDQTTAERPKQEITRSIRPNNEKLLDYFAQRGIDRDIVQQYTKQIHYKAGDKSFFGIGLENLSGGVEIRNPMMKSKIGVNDISVIGGSKDKVVVFEGMTDMLSAMQTLKDQNRQRDFSAIVLNSVTNTDKAIQRLQNFKGTLYLALDGDEAGNKATKSFQEVLGLQARVLDIRDKYQIGQNQFNDLNEFLMNQKKTLNFENKQIQDKDENTNRNTQQGRISNTIGNGESTTKSAVGRISSESQSEQEDNRDHDRGQRVYGNNAGNGFVRSEEQHTRLQRGGGDTLGAGRNSQGANGEETSVVRGEWRGLEVAGEGGATLLKDTTDIPELDALIEKYKGQKISNEEVTELVSVASFVDNGGRVQLAEKLKVTDELKDLLKQYETGGVAKSGRGVLDEYYTEPKLVEVVGKIISQSIEQKNGLKVLEPSVGTGHFLSAIENFKDAQVRAFEINETTARISKILNPNIELNLRSFETEFISPDGTYKKDKTQYSNQYDLVIGNPPYGQHRGFFKGVGEEPNISRYEDYFVKRSLDTMKEGGTLAMVLPSGWLNRQKGLDNAELQNAYRLPVGAFSGTQVGTDIIVLTKDSQKRNLDISQYFEENPHKVLGQIREKTNRFGRLEPYVHGSLDEAIASIDKDLANQAQKQEQKEASSSLIEQNRTGVYTEFAEMSDLEKYTRVDIPLLEEFMKRDNDNKANWIIRTSEAEEYPYSKHYFEVWDNGEMIGRSRVDIGDGLKINAPDFEALAQIILREKGIDTDYPADYLKIPDYTEHNAKTLAMTNRERIERAYDYNNLLMGKDINFKGDKYEIVNIIPSTETLVLLPDGNPIISTKKVPLEGEALDIIDEKLGFIVPDPKQYFSFSQQLTQSEKLETSFVGQTSKTWDDLFPSNEATSKDIKQDDLFAEETQTDIHEKSDELSVEDRQLTTEKVKEAIEVLESIKFKSFSVTQTLDQYKGYLYELENDKSSYTTVDFERISKEADKTLASKKEESEYLVQESFQLKNGVIKYQFEKNDEVVNSSLQNNPNLTKEQIEAFDYTEYNGVLNDPDKFRKYANYIEGEWKHDFYYAEGNIYAKLDQLEQDKSRVSEEQYTKQKALLEGVLPTPKALEDIVISPNHEFVHKFSLGEREVEKNRQVYGNFGAKKWERYTEIEEYTLADKFKDFVQELPSEALRNSSTWEVNQYVDNQSVTGSNKERNALVRERRKEVANDLFDKFLKEELPQADKERFVKEFNRNYNNIHIPNYSQFPLFSQINKNFKGKPLELTEVQKAGIGRLTTKGVGLLAHEVGFGKTLSGILAMHEAMERGSAKRPLIVVPNDTIMKQWVETIAEVIPNAKVNVLGNLGKGVDLSNFDNKDNEISIVTYSGFNNIGFKEEVTSRLAERFSYISAQETKPIKNVSERELQLDYSKVEETRGKMMKGKVYDWEDFGFDHLTFDEVHNANHIVGKVRLENRSFASDFRSQNQRTSQLGINTWIASQYIQEQTEGRNITLLSATPFTNKPLEYYSILSLVANERLEERGYFNVNTFFDTFMEADSEMEINAVGDIDYKSNVKRFKNNALFQQLLGEFIDIKGEEDNPELVRPNRINKEYQIQQNDLTKQEYAKLNSNYDDTEKGAVLTHILNARLTALSPYLSPHYEDTPPSVKEFVENSPKLKTTMDLIAQNKQDNKNAGQIIYSELAVNEFPKLRAYLIEEVGYKDKEVAMITGATSKIQRDKIQEAFNKGDIKVIIGSSAIQEGMNLQENTSDMYLLSLPYNFTALRQTEGRAWRQGNKFENVRINYMLTEDSIDVFMLQKLQDKQARYIEAMKSNVNILDISDISTAELKTALITDPLVRANIEIKVETKRLEQEILRLNADSSFILRKQKGLLEAEMELSKSIKGREWTLKIIENSPKEETKEYYRKLLENNNKAIETWKGIVDKEGAKLGIDSGNGQTIKDRLDLINKAIEEIEAKKELLPEKHKLLTEQYIAEKEERTQQYNSVDLIKERAEENKSFYKLRKETEEEQGKRVRR